MRLRAKARLRHTQDETRTEERSAEDGPSGLGQDESRAESSRDEPRWLTDVRLDWILGGIVLVAYVGVQMWLLLGPHPYDPARYFAAAVEFPDLRADRWTTRIGLIAPVRLAVRTLGPSEAALYAVPLATGLLLAAAVYVAALALIRDRLVAGAAALVTVLNPNFLLNSSFIFPDTLATATFTAGFACLVLGAARPPAAARSWTPTLYATCAGFFFGWSYLIREFSVILLPAVVAAIVLLRYPVRRAAAVAGAAVATASLDLLYGWLQYGNAFMHADILLRRQSHELQPERLAWMNQLRDQLESPVDTVLVFPRLLLAWDVGWLFLLLLAIFTVAVIAIRDKRLVLTAVWLVSFGVIMTALGRWWLPSGDLALNITNIRYWYPVIPPLAIGAFGGVTLLIRRCISGRHVGALASAATATLGVAVLAPGAIEFSRCAPNDAWRNDPSQRWHELRSWFTHSNAKRYTIVWTDYVTARLVPAFTSSTFGDRVWFGDVRTLRPRARLVPATRLYRSVILLHKKRGLPEGAVLAELRRDWSPIFVSSDAQMVLLAPNPVPHAETVDSGLAWSSPPVGKRSGAGSCGVNPYAPPS